MGSLTNNQYLRGGTMTDPTSTADGATREAILRTAAILFQERGYAKTKVVDIARAVGITPPSLYWHFASKEDILFEYLRGEIEEFNSRIAAAIDGIDDPVARLRALAVAHTRAQLEFRDQAQTVLSMTHSSTQLSAALKPERLEEIRALMRVHINRTKALIDEGIRSGDFSTPDANALAFAVLNICEYTALWFRPDKFATVAGVAAANGEFAVRMATGQRHAEGQPAGGQSATGKDGPP